MPSPNRNCLVVTCHPLADSLCQHLADRVIEQLERAECRITRLDLYQSGFSPVLKAEERSSYYDADYDWPAVKRETEALKAAETLVLVFPTWWFGYPAMLKGWFDRVWAPGVAFEHDLDRGAIKPLLSGLGRCLAITTTGSPWWVDRLIMRQPVRKHLKRAVLGACAPNAKLHMLTLHGTEVLRGNRLNAFKLKIDKEVKRVVG